MVTPKYRTVVTAALTKSGRDTGDATPAVAEIKCLFTYDIPGATNPTRSIQTITNVQTNSTFAGDGLVLGTFDRSSWFVPTGFRCDVSEVDNPAGPDFVISSRTCNLGSSEDWADGHVHTATNTNFDYTVVMTYKVTKVA
ncbi:hypothetical protein FOMG_16703 [Fusarium oxysporum f. sp. melonis 26406]|uniref:Uncharacterized protein n=1 Tax=Fusarium oxysporum f. sp. melonis 26406 TaxID=1089452 RepID=W9ZDV6_FUSOX|nr:hypothetical protein FOMG_16703 [Fusarium oxysporum f. sp. melonis 26406]